MTIPDRYISRDGEIIPGTLSDGAYIFQNIHTLGGKPRHTAAHIDVLRTAARKLLGMELQLTANELQRRIVNLTEACVVPSRVSVRVIVRLYATGTIEIACDEPSIYAGYVLRSLRPDAICLNIAPPLPSMPTSAAEQTRVLADAVARSRGVHTAILTDATGYVVSESAQPIFIVDGYNTITPPVTAAEESVERRLVREAVCKSGRPFVEQPISTADLATADEIFMADHRGITSIAHIGRKPYMSIITDTIASHIENITL